MDDKAFQEFVRSHASQLETDTLQKVIEHLQSLVAQLLTGKPPDLKVGSCIHALELSMNWNKYG
jgi:hypothetical protein